MLYLWWENCLDIYIDRRFKIWFEEVDDMFRFYNMFENLVGYGKEIFGDRYVGLFFDCFSVFLYFVLRNFFKLVR